jgi:hypothetical protein
LTSSAGGWLAEATYTDHILPNSLLHYHFRVTDATGTQTDGPEASILTADDRFKWQTVSGPVVRLHWNGGSTDVGQAALDIGEKAVSKAAELLGVSETEPIDFFVYDNEQDFRDALGPGLRENVAGTAFAENRTMYAYLTPDQVGQEWARILVTHELTHLVFDTATRNIYRPAPHWLNEGIATYLSEGFAERWQVAWTGRERPTDSFRCRASWPHSGPATSASTTATPSQSRRWISSSGPTASPSCGSLIRSYSEGLSDDDAFSRATGLDLAGFNAAWMKSIGADVPPELGPQPGATAPAGGQSGPPPVRPGGPPSSGGAGPGVAGQFSTGSIVLAVAVLSVVVLVALRYARRQPPPPAMWPPSGGAYGEPPPAPLPPWRAQGEMPQPPLPPDNSPSEPPSEWRP